MTNARLVYRYANLLEAGPLRPGYDRIVFAGGDVEDIRHVIWDSNPSTNLDTFVAGVEVKDGFVHVRYGSEHPDFYYSPAEVARVTTTNEPALVPEERYEVEALIAANEQERSLFPDDLAG